MPDGEESLRLIRPNRHDQTLDVQIRYEGPAWTQNGFAYRAGRTRDNEHVHVKRAVGGESAEQALRNEIWVAEKLQQGLNRASYPAELAWLTGFTRPTDPRPADTDPAGAEPLLVAAVAGKRLSTLTQQVPFHGESLAAAIDSLLRAVRHLHINNIVCRAIHPDFVSWDGAQLQIAEFPHAVALGRARNEPWTDLGFWSPQEQRRGEDDVDPRDDVFGVAQLLLYLASGLDPGSPRAMAERLREYGELQLLLESCFGAVHARPSSLELIQRRGIVDPAPRRGGAGEREQEVRRRYERLRSDQRKFLREQDEVRRREEMARLEAQRADEERQQRLRDEAYARDQAALRRAELLKNAKFVAGAVGAVALVIVLIVAFG